MWKKSEQKANILGKWRQNWLRHKEEQKAKNMPAPKGHPPYPGSERGAEHGYKGKPQDAWAEEDITELGEGLLVWMQGKENLWIQRYFLELGITKRTTDYLRTKFPKLQEYWAEAEQFQLAKLHELPFYKKADFNMGRFILNTKHGIKEAKDDPLAADPGVIRKTTEEIQKACEKTEDK